MPETGYVYKKEKERYAGLSRCEGYDVGRMGGNEKELAMDQNNI